MTAGARWWRRARSSPALLAFLLAPVLGELLSSSVPMPGFLLAWLPLALLYGTGALLCREAAFRWGTGWAGILLLGLAYGIYEEGLVVRSFFDPAWPDLGPLGVYGRAAGVNWIWTELLTFFHAAVSIAATVALVEIVHPRARQRAWLGRRGLIWCGVGLALWLPLGAAAFMDASWIHLAVSALVIAALVVAARTVRPPLPAPRTGVVPRPRRFLLVSLPATAGVFLFAFIAAEQGAPPAVTALVMAAFPAGAAALILRWSGRSWDDRHRLAVVSGMLGFLAFLHVFNGGPAGPGVAAAAVGTLWWLQRRVAERLERDRPGAGQEEVAAA